jgi:DNA-binding NarL/FixJ family response regulator
MTGDIRILVVDDHPVVRDGLVAILQTQPDFEVVGEASTGLEAVRLVEDTRPNVVLLDLEMPEMDGVEALRRMRDLKPETAVVVFTAFDTDERILGSLQAGAAGYLLKGAPRQEVFNAIRVVSQGGSLLGPMVVSKLIDRIIATTGDSPDAPVFPPLTPREKEVLDLLARGLTNKQIADRLVVTERTAKFHVSAILRKLGAANRTEAISIASQLHLVEL